MDTRIEVKQGEFKKKYPNEYLKLKSPHVFELLDSSKKEMGKGDFVLLLALGTFVMGKDKVARPVKIEKTENGFFNLPMGILDTVASVGTVKEYRRS